MLRIRLSRVGKSKQASYRIMVADGRAPRDGAFVEQVGTYNPRTDPATVTLKEERVRFWLGNGALPSEAVAGILRRSGVVEKAGA